MKINKVRFKNINSLRGEHLIDFTKEPLKSAGLFAITGPTGSGKTTLLDVICLAIFNRIPRINKAISRSVVADSGAILTRNTQDCYAEVEYECSKGIFRSKWEISTARTGALRDYHMEIGDLQSGNTLDVRRSDVPNQNEAHIGLNYEQFVKSMLLAQGEFAKFLQANRNDRSGLLEKITGTNIYRELGRRAFEKYREHGIAIDNLKKEQSIFKNQLLDDEKLNKITIQHTELKELLAQLETEIIDSNKKKELLEEVIKLKNRLSKLVSEQKILAERQTVFQSKEGEKIRRHEALMPFASELDSWKNYRQKQEEITIEIELLQSANSGINQKIIQLKNEVKLLVGSDYNKDDIPVSLHHFNEKAQNLLNERNELRSLFKEKFASLVVLKSRGVNFDATDIDVSIDLFNKIKAETKDNLKSISTSLGKETKDNPHEQLGLLDDKVDFIKRAAPIEKLIIEKNKDVEKLTAKYTSLKLLYEKLPSEIIDLNQQLVGQQKVTENLGLKIENQKLKAELKTHRQHLKEGEPCPLCGAIEHPFANKSEVIDNEQEKELKVELEMLSNYNKLVIEKETELKQISVQLKQLESDIAGEQTKLQVFNKELDVILQNFTESELNIGIEPLSELLKKQHEQLREYINIKEKLEAFDNAQANIDQLKEAYEKGMLKKKEFEAIYPKNEKELPSEIQNLLNSWTKNAESLSNTQKNLQKQEKAITDVKKVLAQLNQKLSSQLKELGYHTIEKALNVRITENEFSQLNNQQNELIQNIKLNDQALKQSQESITDKEKITQGYELKTIKAKLETLISQRSESSEKYNDFDRQLKNHHDNILKVSKLQNQILAAEKEGKQWVLLNQYIGDKTGNKFNQFAQDLTLSQLVVLANRRLQNLSDRYLLDKAKEDEDDSLMIIDLHMGNERRSVKTLSGGETFILSLSLALALSDLASRNVEINSLFIDEGFGTLDPEVLDQTLDTLEKLQSEGGKTIGIISHVEALKERISTQIKLVRNGQGFSSLQVV